MEVLMILPKSKEVVILGSRVFVMLICLSGNAALKFVVGVRTLQRPELMRGGAVWQLVGLITRRSQVQILPPLPLRSVCLASALISAFSIFTNL